MVSYIILHWLKKAKKKTKDLYPSLLHPLYPTYQNCFFFSLYIRSVFFVVFYLCFLLFTYAVNIYSVKCSLDFFMWLCMYIVFLTNCQGIPIGFDYSSCFLIFLEDLEISMKVFKDRGWLSLGTWVRWIYRKVPHLLVLYQKIMQYTSNVPILCLISDVHWCRRLFFGTLWM